MDTDSTLDSFASEDEETKTGAKDEAPESSKAIAPAQATYTWSPDGAACAACGEVVTRRWRDEIGLVCESCKSW